MVTPLIEIIHGLAIMIEKLKIKTKPYPLDELNEEIMVSPNTFDVVDKLNEIIGVLNKEKKDD